MSQPAMIYIANTLICLLIAWTCICRLDPLSTNTLYRVRVKYSVLLAGACTMAGFPVLFPNVEPSWYLVGINGVILFLIVCEMPDWRHGPPPSSYRRMRMQRGEQQR